MCISSYDNYFFIGYKKINCYIYNFKLVIFLLNLERKLFWKQNWFRNLCFGRKTFAKRNFNFWINWVAFVVILLKGMVFLKMMSWVLCHCHRDFLQAWKGEKFPKKKDRECIFYAVHWYYMLSYIFVGSITWVIDRKIIIFSWIVSYFNIFWYFIYLN